MVYTVSKKSVCCNVIIALVFCVSWIHISVIRVIYIVFRWFIWKIPDTSDRRASLNVNLLITLWFGTRVYAARGSQHRYGRAFASCRQLLNPIALLDFTDLIELAAYTLHCDSVWQKLLPAIFFYSTLS